MPDDGPVNRNDAGDGSFRAPQQRPSIFAIPPTLKRIFDKFPLTTYAANGLPRRAPRTEQREAHTLHVFTTEDDVRRGRPSYNPGCLKWEAYLKFAGVPFKTVPSNNHASPSGALPFLLAATSPADPTRDHDPVSSNKLKRWVASQRTAVEKLQEPEDKRLAAYTSLIDTQIRKAWLYQLYLLPANATLLRKLYVAPCSINRFVQLALASQLRGAAETEVVKACASNTLVEEDIMREAGEALLALSTLLAEDEWFFGLVHPGLFDAAVFAYVHLILDESLEWKENKLAEMLKVYDNLKRHEERIMQLYYRDDGK